MALLTGCLASRFILPVSPAFAKLKASSKKSANIHTPLGRLCHYPPLELRSKSCSLPEFSDSWVKPSSREPRPKLSTRTSAGVDNMSSRTSFGQPAMEPIVLKPKGKHTATVVWLHGLGDTGRGWSDLADSMSLPHIKWVLPTAPVRPVSINGGFPCPAWFDIKGLSSSAPDDVEGLDAAASYVAGLLEKESSLASAGAGPVKIILGGFSQGGGLALYTASRHIAGTLANGTSASGIPILATICLSGWLPNAKGLKAAMDVEASTRAAELPMLICHGKDDMVVPHSFGQLSAETLSTLGFAKVGFKSYRGLGHGADPEELRDVRDWVLKVAPP